jgi:hypothetical protein
MERISAFRFRHFDHVLPAANGLGHAAHQRNVFGAGAHGYLRVVAIWRVATMAGARGYGGNFIWNLSGSWCPRKAHTNASLNQDNFDQINKFKRKKRTSFRIDLRTDAPLFRR